MKKLTIGVVAVLIITLLLVACATPTPQTIVKVVTEEPMQAEMVRSHYDPATGVACYYVPNAISCVKVREVR